MRRYTSPNDSLRAWIEGQLIRGHVGAANAITWAELAVQARRAGFAVQADERNLREEVNAMQDEGLPGALICSSSRKPYGVYIAASVDEFRAYKAETMSRATRLLDKIGHQERLAEEFFLAEAHQLSLFIEQERVDAQH